MFLQKIQQDLRSKGKGIENATPAPEPQPQPTIIKEPEPERITIPQYHSEDAEIDKRYQLINAIINLEYSNTKKKILEMLSVQERIGYSDDQVNELLLLYAPKTINKVFNKYTHMKNLLIYAGIGKPDTGEDKKVPKQTGVRSNKANTDLFKRDS